MEVELGGVVVGGGVQGIFVLWRERERGRFDTSEICKGD